MVLIRLGRRPRARGDQPARQKPWGHYPLGGNPFSKCGYNHRDALWSVVQAHQEDWSLHGGRASEQKPGDDWPPWGFVPKYSGARTPDADHWPSAMWF